MTFSTINSRSLNPKKGHWTTSNGSLWRSWEWWEHLWTIRKLYRNRFFGLFCQYQMIMILMWTFAKPWPNSSRMIQDLNQDVSFFGGISYLGKELGFPTREKCSSLWITLPVLEVLSAKSYVVRRWRHWRLASRSLPAAKGPFWNKHYKETLSVGSWSNSSTEPKNGFQCQESMPWY